MKKTRLKSTRLTLFKNRPTLIEVEPPREKQMLLEIAASAALATLPYTLEYGLQEIIDLGGDKVNLSHWTLATDLDLMISLGKFSESLGMKYEAKYARLIDAQTGLVIYILINSAIKEVRLLFGHTTSGSYVSSMHLGPSIMRTLANIPITYKQWQANFQNAWFGKTPRSYQQAQSIVAKLLEEIPKSPQLKEAYTLSLSGHSKGGAEAAYAALINGGLHAYCFGSAEWGKGPTTAILDYYAARPEALQKAVEQINHYSIEGDPIPLLSKRLPLKNLYLMGRMMTFPAQKGENLLFLYRLPGLGPHIGFSYFINQYIKSL